MSFRVKVSPAASLKNKGVFVFSHLHNGASWVNHEAQPSVDWTEDGFLPTKGGCRGRGAPQEELWSVPPHVSLAGAMRSCRQTQSPRSISGKTAYMILKNSAAIRPQYIKLGAGHSICAHHVDPPFITNVSNLVLPVSWGWILIHLCALVTSALRSCQCVPGLLNCGCASLSGVVDSQGRVLQGLAMMDLLLARAN